VTGVHDPATSHFRLLEAFAERDLLLRAHAFAEARGYSGHEFGDAMLILGGGDAARGLVTQPAGSGRRPKRSDGI
jgi:hypothetical protein